MSSTFLKVLALSAATFLGSTAFALSINDPGVVGTIRSGEPAGDAHEILYVNTLLGMGVGATQTVNHGGPVGSHDYARSLLDVTGLNLVSAVGLRAEADKPGFTLVVPEGWEYVLAKFNGPNGGDVLWYLGGASVTLPADSFGLWVNRGGNGYGLSHWTVFNRLPPPSVPDGGATVVMIGAGVAVLGLMRRRCRKG